MGIGPEIIAKALEKMPRSGARFTIISARCAFEKYRLSKDVNFIEVKTKYKKPSLPAPSKYGGDISYKSLRLAVKLMLQKKYDALVTAPISKSAWLKAGVKFMGHTEVLDKYARCGRGATMMFISGPVACALVSEHYAIKDLPAAITKARIIKTVANFAEVLPKRAAIGVAALNPHAGDDGKIGREEIEIIAPALKNLRALGFNVSGPYPSDELWLKVRAGRFGGIVCMYHDQALSGLKLCAKKPAVHITAGLKFLRVSPTHGTAFDIAGKNRADAEGMAEALKFAARAKFPKS